MKTTIRSLAVTFLLTCVFVAPTLAWSDTGHMAVAFVAYQRLNPATRNRVDFLIRLNPKFNEWQNRIPSGTSPEVRRGMLFMIAATWADQIKGDGLHEQPDGSNGGNTPPNNGTADDNIGYSDRKKRKYWHFIDLPFSTDGTRLENPPVPNALTQIAVFRSVLAYNSSDRLKSYDLVWLMHLVGDVHQPLHCAARFTQSVPHGDEGGNLVNVCDPHPQCNRRLHGFWDGLLGTSSDPNVAIQVGQDLPQANAVQAANLDVNAWILEGFELARTNVYRMPIGPGAGPFTITSEYRNNARQLARERVALAGARLANILNTELK